MFLPFLILMLGLITQVSCKPKTVRVQGSKIVGKTRTNNGMTANEFLGIPYAQPPVGQYRFKKPAPLESYPNKLNATNLTVTCDQYLLYYLPWGGQRADYTLKSEDCLYLSIWTPKDASKKNTKAVIVWIYGGEFRNLDNVNDIYSGLPLSSLGDVVVVTVNFRVDIMGFFTSNTQEAPGNAGIQDILEALKWVNKNIRSFGGDPKQITVVGEGSRAVIAAILSNSAQAQGLFQRQILMSGSLVSELIKKREELLPLGQMVVNQSSNEYYDLRENPDEAVNSLRDVSGFSVSLSTLYIKPNSFNSFVAVYGDDLLPDDPRKATKDGNFGCKDTLIGNTANDGTIYAYHEFARYVQNTEGKDADTKNVNKTLGKEFIRNVSSSVPEDIVDFYLDDSVEEDDYEKVRERIGRFIGDSQQICPNEFYAEKCAEQNNNVYFYAWNYYSNKTFYEYGRNGVYGVFRFSEVEFVFGAPLMYPDRYDPEDIPVAKQVIQVWTSFAKNGEPTVQNQTQPWPSYSQKSPLARVLEPATNFERTVKGPYYLRCRVLRSYLGF